MTGKEFAEKLQANISQVIVGKEEVVSLLIAALLADGHVLLEDVPGTGKTKLAKALAKSLAADFSRIQFTPDLLPTDITGLNVFNSKVNDFEFRRGPVFANVLLADEINRATPRTQAGLLESMEEKQVTVDGTRYLPGDPFFVIATQNPVETAGTFPLPEAQMDRFMMRLSMGLPEREEELAILDKYMSQEPLLDLTSVVTIEELKEARKEANEVYVHPCIREYIVDIVSATRKSEDVIMGVSPRGSLSLLRSAKAYACMQGRNFVIPDDIRQVAISVLSHRLVLGYGLTRDSKKMMEQMLEQIPVPTEDFSI